MSKVENRTERVKMDHLPSQPCLKTMAGLFYVEIPQLAEIGWVHHGFLTRKGGLSLPPYDSLNVGEDSGDRKEGVCRNRDRIAAAYGVTPKKLILLNQMQKDGILILKEPAEIIPSSLEADATITNTPNIFLGIQTADCIPILVVDQRRKVIAAIHAGRRGTALRITRRVLKKMKEEFGSSPEDLIIALGPSIGPCCYEIDDKVFRPEWKPFTTFLGGGKMRISLPQINRDQMKEEGIKEEQIFSIDLCTCCHTDLFFSYRREGRTGRQLSLIGIII